MVLKMLASAAPYFPTEYTVHIVATLIAVLTVRTIAQGRKTTRERDLHARVILVTGAFSPIGLTLLESLAQRGAHIIALTPHAVDSEQVKTYIELLRSTTANEQIYAEQCDLASPPSIHAFATRFTTGHAQRLDALIFTHEYRHIGAARLLAPAADPAADPAARETASLATFLLTTLLLPALLTAPAARDIRIITLVNRFYAAAAALPPPFAPPPGASASLFLREGARALRTAAFTRHLQRVLDALPAPPVPAADGTPGPGPRPAMQKSNIVVVSVSPGLSRAETVAPLLRADWSPTGHGFSVVGLVLYIALYPLLLLLTKSAAASIQSVLHVLFLPTPFKAGVAEGLTGPGAEKGELLKPGALYAECAVVRVRVGAQTPGEEEEETEEKTQKEEEEKAEDEKAGEGEGEALPDDGELGGERAGRAVWEAYEAGLKAWEARHPPPPPPDIEGATAPA
ncbi:hypothetical protein B0H15DRAFT_938408 [Mycena belliarum]|uniref:Ketoreductase (KR) domain-containing protein n=1 Tax=Mycena belliarum TaxID=1033014 RepID=A0AAD6XWQ5_9AGAR|nr:hypothetical protein B0H15DRAFT_938408 [Mycena belliae]